MSETSKRSTVYFAPQLHAALRLKAAHTHRSLPDIVNDAVRAALAEDQEDLAAFEGRASEPTMSYEALLDDLKVFRKSVAKDLCSIPNKDVARIHATHEGVAGRPTPGRQ